MEIIIGLLVVAGLAYWYFTRNPLDKGVKETLFTPQKDEVPYKVEAAPEVKTPEPAKCGCGRSPTGYCIGLHALTTEAWAVHPDNPNKVEAPVVEAAPAKKATAPKKTAGAKPAAKKSKPAARTAKPKAKKA